MITICSTGPSLFSLPLYSSLCLLRRSLGWKTVGPFPSGTNLSNAASLGRLLLRGPSHQTLQNRFFGSPNLEPVLPKDPSTPSGTTTSSTTAGTDVLFTYDSFIWTHCGISQPYRYVVVEPLRSGENQTDKEKENVSSSYYPTTTSVGLDSFPNTYLILPSLSPISNREEVRDLARSLVDQSDSQCLIVEWPGLHNDTNINQRLYDVMMPRSTHLYYPAETTTTTTTEQGANVDKKIIHNDVDQTCDSSTSSGSLRRGQAINLVPSALAGRSDLISQRAASSGRGGNQPTPAINPATGQIHLEPDGDPTPLSARLQSLYFRFLLQFLHHVLSQWQCPHVVIVAAGNAGTILLRLTDVLLSNPASLPSYVRPAADPAAAAANVFLGAPVRSSLFIGGAQSASDEEWLFVTERFKDQVDALILLGPTWRSPLRRFYTRKYHTNSGTTTSNDKVFDYIHNNCNDNIQKINSTKITTTNTPPVGPATKSGEPTAVGAATVPIATSAFRVPNRVIAAQFAGLTRLLQRQGWTGNIARRILKSEYFVHRLCSRGYTGQPSEETLKQKLVCISRMTLFEIHTAIWCGLVDPFETEVELIDATAAVLRRCSEEEAMLKTLVFIPEDAPTEELLEMGRFAMLTTDHPFLHRDETTLNRLAVTKVKGGSSFYEEFPDETARHILSFIKKEVA